MLSSPMTKITKRSFVLAALIGSALLFSASALAKKEELPEVSKDGLHLLKDTKVAVAYAKPGASLDRFTKVQLVDCFVAFKKNWQRDYNMDEVGLTGRVSDKDAEDIKKKLATEFKSAFAHELAKEGYPVVDDTGKDVLIVRPALINVDVYAPDTNRGWNRTLIRSAGEMTLYMELYDGADNTLLARVMDPQADDEAFARQASSVTNKAAADRIIYHWAELLAKHLGEVQSK